MKENQDSINDQLKIYHQDNKQKNTQNRKDIINLFMEQLEE